MVRCLSLFLMLALAANASGQVLMAVADPTPVSTTDPVLVQPDAIFVDNSGGNATFDFTPMVSAGTNLTFDIIAGTLPGSLTEGDDFNTETGQLIGSVGTGYGSGTYVIRAMNPAFVDIRTTPNEYCDHEVRWHCYTSTEHIDSGDAYPHYNDTDGRLTILDEAISTNGTAVVLTGLGTAFDGGGFTITHNNATAIAVPNGSFETGTGAAATGWDFTNATNADRYEGDYLLNQVHEGDFCLRFQDTTASEYVTNSTTIELAANTTYVLSATFMYGTTTTQSATNPGVDGYVTLDGTTDRVLITENNPFNRGMQYKEYRFTTGGSPETYSFIAGIVGHASGTHDFYIDDIQVTKTHEYGVAIGPKNSVSTETSDITTYGSANGATVANVVIQQGQDNGSWCHAIHSYANTNIGVVGVAATVQGANCSNFYHYDASAIYDSAIVGNTFTSNVTTVTSRDGNDGAMAYSAKGYIGWNTFIGGPHTGVLTGRDSWAHNNTFDGMLNRYTNGFAIICYDSAGSGAKIYKNTVDNTGASEQGPGILCAGTIGTLIYDNVVTTKLLANNPEYGGPQTGGVYAMQLEDAQNKEVFNNTLTAQSTVADAQALRLTNDAADDPQDLDGLNIHDNTFIADRVSGSKKVLCVALNRFNSTGTAEITFENNTLRTDEMLIGSSVNSHGLTLDSCTVEWTGSSGFKLVEVEDYEPTSSARRVDDIRFLDATFADGSIRGLMELSGCYQYLTGDPMTTSDVGLQWTTTIHVEDSGNTPIAGATVVIEDADSAEVVNDTTDASGNVVAVLDEWVITGTTKADKTDHTVTVTATGETFSPVVFTADSVQTITVTAQ